jgi:hypothetical protein
VDHDLVFEECLGCDPGRADVEDRGTPETALLDAGRSGEPPRRNAARINDLLRGRVSRFSLDALVNIATGLGCRVRVDLEAA